MTLHIFHFRMLIPAQLQLVPIVVVQVQSKELKNTWTELCLHSYFFDHLQRLTACPYNLTLDSHLVSELPDDVSAPILYSDLLTILSRELQLAASPDPHSSWSSVLALTYRKARLNLRLVFSFLIQL